MTWAFASLVLLTRAKPLLILLQAFVRPSNSRFYPCFFSLLYVLPIYLIPLT